MNRLFGFAALEVGARDSRALGRSYRLRARSQPLVRTGSEIGSKISAKQRFNVCASGGS
jgi:hypothetical protein